MSRAIERTTQFKRDYKRERKAFPRLEDLLVPVLQSLVEDHDLPERLRDHSLGGD